MKKMIEILEEGQKTRQQVGGLMREGEKVTI